MKSAWILHVTQENCHEIHTFFKEDSSDIDVVLMLTSASEDVMKVVRDIHSMSTQRKRICMAYSTKDVRQAIDYYKLDVLAMYEDVRVIGLEPSLKASVILAPERTLCHVFGLWDPLDKMPNNMVQLREVARKACPDFRCHLYDPTALTMVIGEERMREIEEVVSQRRVAIADIVRYYLMWLKGGFYLDLDVRVRRDLASIVDACVSNNVRAALFTEHDDCNPSWMGEREDKKHTKRLYNCMFWSQPGHPMWKDCIDLSLSRCRMLSASNHVLSDTDILWATGPDVITTVWHTRKDEDVRVYNYKDSVDVLQHTCAGTWRHEQDKNNVFS
jgi:hypothetical protein